MSSASELRDVALAEFAGAGFAATSLQRIADRAGLSKSSVLYHYSSKETLLEAAIGPAIDSLDAFVTSFEGMRLTVGNRQAFVEGFTDFLLAHRLEVHLFINQGPALVDVPVIDRVNAVILRLADFFASNSSSTLDTMRFGVALGGAAYILGAAQNYDIEPLPVDETRAALVTIMSELLAPVSAPGALA